MAIKFEKITAGMTLFDIHSYKMGNMSMRQLGKWDVKVISIDSDKRTALVSWNGNRPEVWSEHKLKRLNVAETKKYKEQGKRERARRAARGPMR
jgi:hypothetical protein